MGSGPFRQGHSCETRPVVSSLGNLGISSWGCLDETACGVLTHREGENGQQTVLLETF